ncbi:hypothetical protein RJT34_25372 [Clitoria ternatea]|uniref:Uncharacterized protein n=1 Tax=Clitoria ternatea TaxID=43366 RepID=A0AAN9FRR6_CLITE
MAQHLKPILCLVLALAALYSTEAMDFAVSNNAGNSIGAARFDKEIGADYAKQTLTSSYQFIHSLFEHSNVRSVQNVNMVVEIIDGVTFASNNTIHVSAEYIETYPTDVKKEITGLLYHEMAHILLLHGNGQAPSGLIEGMADFVRLKAGYAPDYWSPPGVGYDWGQGYEVTAQFLNYCDCIKNGFVVELNKKMKSGYSEGYFTELLGKPVTDLWSDYQYMYRNK